jgi:hypothetical protein
MRISTAMNHLARFERRLEAIYRNAALCKQPHAELLEEMKALWADHAKARLPGWCASKLVTRRDILAQKHYDHLIWEGKRRGRGSAESLRLPQITTDKGQHQPIGSIDQQRRWERPESPQSHKLG